MADAPDAPAPTGESEQTPATTNQAPVANDMQTQAPAQKAENPDMHGFTSEQLAEMKKFYDANGGFEKVKSKISNPEKPTEKPAEVSEKKEEPTSHTQETEPTAQAPKGAITAQEFLAKQYFQALAGEEKYAPIAKGIANGDYLKEMAAFGINAMNPDGSINDQKVRMYLDLKAQTVPAKPTSSEPNASAAPTVEYITVGDKIDNIDQAYQVLMQKNHPKMEMAKEYIRNHYNAKSGNK